MSYVLSSAYQIQSPQVNQRNDTALALNSGTSAAGNDVGTPSHETSDTGLVYTDTDEIAQFEFYFPPNAGATDSYVLDGPLVDIYYRVYMTPDSLPLGIIGGDVDVTLRLWNAEINELEITGITTGFAVFDGDGNQLNFPIQAGETELFEFRLFIPADGPATQSETLTVEYTADGVTFTKEIPISLSRAVIWHYPPHFERWSQEYTYKTAITHTEDETEQRHSLTPRPFVTNVGEYWAVDDAMREMQGVLWDSLIMIVPDWTRRLSTAMELPPGTVAIPLVDFDIHVYEGQQYMLIDGTDPQLHEYELVTGEVDNGVLLLSGGVSRYWPKGSVIVPADVAVVSNQVKAEYPTACRLEGEVGFRKVEPVDLPDIEPPELDGIPVFLKPPDWISNPETDFQRERRRVDSINNADWYQHRNRGQVSGQYLFHLKNRDEINELLGWIKIWKGRQRTFYMPTWINDLGVLESKGNILTTELTLDKFYKQQRGRDAAFVMNRGGAVSYGKIVAVDPIPPDLVRWELDPQTDIFLSPTIAGFLQEVRLASDTVQIDYSARSCATVTLQVTTP